MKLLQNLIALFFFVCLAALIIYIGAYVLLLLLVVGVVAYAWYAVKFWFLRKEIQEAVREHQGTSFHDALRRAQDEQTGGPVIDGEFEEINEEEKKP